jgi:hypothetical protein
MPKEEEFLGMSLFDDTNNLEINMDFNPDDLEEDVDIDNLDEQEENIQEQENPEEQDNLDEDENPEEVGENEDQEEEGDDSDENSPNIYSSFASVLNEQGLLPSLDLQGIKDIKNADDLSALFKSEIETQSKSYLLEKLGQEGYDALEKGISLAEYQQYQDNVLTLDSITEDSLRDDIELSKKLIYQDYLSQGIDDKRAMRLLKKSIDAGEDSILEDAIESLGSLKVVEGKRLEKLAAERKEQQLLESQAQTKIDNDLKNSIYNKTEFIKGIKVNKSIQDKVYNSITKVVGKSPTGVLENRLMKERRENPIDFDSKLYYLYELTNGFSDFSKITSKAETSALSKLEKDLRRTKFEGSGTPSYLNDKESYGGIGSEIVF